MNTEYLSRGLALIAEGVQYLSLAYASIDPPLARSGVPDGVPADPADRAAGVSPAPAAPSFDDMPPLPPLPNDLPDEPRLNPQVEAGLGKCPVHGKAWVVKAAGVSKAGKPFPAFWKCAERDANGYCDQKPQPIWRDLHKIPEGAAA